MAACLVVNRCMPLCCGERISAPPPPGSVGCKRDVKMLRMKINILIDENYGVFAMEVM